jgi:hypothetical protein
MDSTTMVKFWGLHPDRFEDTQHFRYKDADHYPAPRNRVAMAIREWLHKDSDPGKSWPLFIARPASFDKAWIDDLLEEHNPFRYTSLDIGSFAQGVIKDFSTAEQKHALKQLMEVPNAGRHNALYDALQQTEQFRRLMVMARG